MLALSSDLIHSSSYFIIYLFSHILPTSFISFTSSVSSCFHRTVISLVPSSCSLILLITFTHYINLIIRLSNRTLPISFFQCFFYNRYSLSHPFIPLPLFSLLLSPLSLFCASPHTNSSLNLPLTHSPFSAFSQSSLHSPPLLLPFTLPALPLCVSPTLIPPRPFSSFNYDSLTHLFVTLPKSPLCHRSRQPLSHQPVTFLVSPPSHSQSVSQSVLCVRAFSL